MTYAKGLRASWDTAIDMHLKRFMQVAPGVRREHKELEVLSADVGTVYGLYYARLIGCFMWHAGKAEPPDAWLVSLSDESGRRTVSYGEDEGIARRDYARWRRYIALEVAKVAGI